MKTKPADNVRCNHMNSCTTGDMFVVFFVLFEVSSLLKKFQSHKDDLFSNEIRKLL